MLTLEEQRSDGAVVPLGEQTLSLEELRSSGEIVDLGQQTLPLTELPLLTEDQGANGRAVVVAGWSTEPVYFGSLVRACVQVIRHGRDRDLPFSDEVCRALTPL